MAHSLRHIFVHHGACTPLRRIGSPKLFFDRLPSHEDLKELERRTILLPRLGDGFYAPAPTTGDAFPWGQLTAHGLRDMRELGKILATPCPGRKQGIHLEDLLIRTVGTDACVQTASAIALGIADASESSQVTEVMMQNQDELYPSLNLEEPGFPLSDSTLTDAEEVQMLTKQAAAAVHATFPDADCNTLSDLCKVISCVWGETSIPKEVSEALGSLAFALWAAPFHANPACASTVLEALLQDVVVRMERASLGDGHQLVAEGDPSVRLFVVPPETLIVLAGTIGVAQEVRKIGHGASVVGAWPSPGSRLEIELVLDREGVPCVHVSYNGEAVAECLGRELLPWESFKPRVSSFLE